MRPYRRNPHGLGFSGRLALSWLVRVEWPHRTRHFVRCIPEKPGARAPGLIRGSLGSRLLPARTEAIYRAFKWAFLIDDPHTKMRRCRHADELTNYLQSYNYSKCTPAPLASHVHRHCELLIVEYYP
jgi:hypothetical protein